MRRTGFVCDESYFWHNSGGGALFEEAFGYIEELGSIESPLAKRRVKNLLEKSGLLRKLTQIAPVMATDEELRFFHTQRHIDFVKALSDGDGGDCGDAGIVGRGSFEIAKLAVGGAIAAVETVVGSPDIKTVYALTRPPGHHAEADRGAGFCIFNNAVIAAKYAQKVLGIGRILILDWDAHHGNGIEDAFYEDDTVLFISLHQEGYDPITRGFARDKGKGAGEGFNINIPLHAGSGDAVYKYAFEKIVTPAANAFKPELIIISAGQDGSFFDPLSRMMLTTEGYRAMTRAVMEIAKSHAQGRVVALHEGGYCAAYVPFCTHAIIEELSGITTDVGDPFLYSMAGTTYNTLLPHQKERVDEICADLSFDKF
ncbi:MAG: class II histone deacetylase [Defluviitaleaceae bacterium]|nr:class II histone deacetylase [Defluviitaleaceae bacterium]